MRSVSRPRRERSESVGSRRDEKRSGSRETRKDLRVVQDVNVNKYLNEEKSKRNECTIV